jgi:hypothetical protein
MARECVGDVIGLSRGHRNFLRSHPQRYDRKRNDDESGTAAVTSPELATLRHAIHSGWSNIMPTRTLQVRRLPQYFLAMGAGAGGAPNTL